MPTPVYGFGPEFAGAVITMNGPAGTILQIPAGVGPTSIPDEALPLLPAWDTDLDLDPVATYPKQAGGSPLGVAMVPLMPDAKRLGKFTLPAGTIKSVRAYLDGSGTGPGDPRVKGVLMSSAGAVVAQTNELVFGRNFAYQYADGIRGVGTTYNAFADGSTRVIVPAVTNPGIGVADKGGWAASPGDVVTLSVEARRISGAPSLFLRAVPRDQADTYLGVFYDSTASVLGNDWVRYNYTLTVPGTAAKTSRIKMELLTSDGAASSFEVRNMMISRGPAAPKFYADRAIPGWYNIPLVSNTAVTAGDYYLGVHVGSDIAPATTNTPSTLQSQINGGAETDTAGWSANGTGAALSRDTAVKKSGNASFKLTLTNASTGDNMTYDSGSVSLVPGDRVTIEAWVYPSVALPAVTTAAYGAQYNGGGTGIACPANVWTKVSHTFVSDFTGTVGPYMRSNTAGTTMTINFDNITVRVQKANSSLLSSGRMAGTSLLGDVNLVTNPKGSVDTAGWSAAVSGTGATGNVTRVTGLDATPWATTGLRLNVTAGSAAAWGEMGGPIPAQKFEPGSTVNMLIAVQANANCTIAYGLNGVDASFNDFSAIGRPTVALTAGRWYYLQSTFTVPVNAFNIYPVIAMDPSTPIAAGQSRTLTAALVQLVANPNNAQPPMLDGDMPGNFWDGAVGTSTARGPEGRVNWIPDPRTAVTANWNANSVTRTSVTDTTSPTGNAIQVSSNTTGGDFFVVPSSWFGIDSTYFPAMAGETWTLSGWVKQNASALAIALAMQASTPTDYHQQASLWFRGGTTDTVSLPTASGRPTLADTWTPFSITATVPALTRSGFIRLHNTNTSGAGPVTSYAGLKLERGTWTADSYFDGTQSGCNFFSTADNSPSIKWQNPDQGDLYSDGVAAMQATVPVQANFNKEIGAQVGYVTP